MPAVKRWIVSLLFILGLLAVPFTGSGQGGGADSERSDGMETAQLAAELRSVVYPLTGSADDFAPLMERIGDARVVLIGEASHGTHEFYATRAELTRRLIEEKGFSAVAVEADFPDAYRVNEYVRGLDGDSSAEEALGGFERFPTWMWRNTVVRDFVEWMRVYNRSRPTDAAQVGFYGLDLYSLHSSMQAVIDYLDKVDPAAAQRARYRYGCFEDFGEDPQVYGYSASLDIDETCQAEVMAQFNDILRSRADFMQADGRLAEDAFFYGKQNARLVVNAEEYYRTMFTGRVSTWNLRDQHMMETLLALMEHLEGMQEEARLVVWAHNSHLGDARATQMGEQGELNVGQLVREHFGQAAVLVGFTTYTGTVTAAHDWGDMPQRMRVRPALIGSYESLFHLTEVPNFLLIPGETNARVLNALRERRLERAIGVIYRPLTERVSHYFFASLPDQFDAVIHYDITRALEPLEVVQPWDTEEAPETFPTGE